MPLNVLLSCPLVWCPKVDSLWYVNEIYNDNNYWLGPENVVLNVVWVDYGMLSQLTRRPQAMGGRGVRLHTL